MRRDSGSAVSPRRAVAKGASTEETVGAPATGTVDAEPNRPAVEPSPSQAGATTPTALEEVTLAFATWIDGSGVARPLSESLVQATILCAIDGERGRQRFVFQAKSETVQAVAPVYWPLRLFPTPDPNRVVIFDGSGLWKRTFQHSLLPPLDASHAELTHLPSPAALPVCLRTINSLVRGGAGSQALVVEGFLPVEAPLFSDIVSQSGFRTEPLPPHPGFLPTRHPVAWYEATVGQIVRSLSEFERELHELRELKAQVEATRVLGLERIAADWRALESELRNRVRFYAHAEMEREAEALHRSTWEQTMGDLDRVRRADAAIASARSAAATSEELAKRVSAAGGDGSVYRDRAKKAHATERQGLQEIREARERIARLHERERKGFQVLTDRVALVEQSAAHDLAEFDLQRADLEAAAAELLATLEAETSRRVAEREQLAAHLVELPNLAGVQTLWFPLWVAEVTGAKGSRFRVFPPMQLRTGRKVGDSIKTFFGGLVLPLEPRTARFEQALRSTIEEALARDPWLNTTMRQIVRTADSTADPEFVQRLAQGLQELREGGWITADQERESFESCSQHLAARPRTEAPPEPGPMHRTPAPVVHGS